MAAKPALLRTVLKSSMPDPDWAATQVGPITGTAAITGSSRVGVFFVARDTSGAVVNPAGTLNMQPVVLASTVGLQGAPPVAVVFSGATDTGVGSGALVTYDDLGSAATLAVRVVSAAGLDAAVASVDIYWFTIA